MSASETTTDDLLPNVHPGDILRHDFLIGSDIPESEVALGAGIDALYLGQLLRGEAAINAEADIRLARYLGVSEGIFLGLQHDYDVEEARRAFGDEFDRIVRRAA